MTRNAPRAGTVIPLGLIRPLVGKYSSRLIGGFVALLIVDLLQLGIPRLVKRAVDLLAHGLASQTALARSALAIFLLALGIAGCRFVWRYLILGFSRMMERDLRADFFRHLLTLDQPFFQKKPVGAIMALATNDLAAVQLAGGMGLVACVDAAIMGIAALACMAYISPRLTLIAVIPMPLLAVLTRVLSARLHHRFLKVQEQFSRLTEFARSTITSIRLLKAYTQERVQADSFSRLGHQYQQDNLRLARVHGMLFPVSGLVGNTSLVLVIFFGGRLVIGGAITVGDFVAFISYLYLLTWPMMAVGWVANLFQRGFTSLGRLDEVMKATPTLVDPPQPVSFPSGQTEISLRNLHFRYAGQEQPALAGVSCVIRPGEIVGLVGRSGTGKSTLCHLLARQYPVEDGALFLNGVDVNHLSLAAVRRRVAYVPQDVLLFSDTVAANIAFGNPGAGREQIETAARICRIHEEILAFGDGYETRIGERGVKLSGGQRQRIALARALLLDRPLLIIDDSLSAVDLETEQEIIAGLAAYLPGRTCLVVSHRIAPLRDAVRIMVFEEGRLLAQGNHAELLATSPFYRTMYTQQQMRHR
ncbi:MAG: ABC transporter ATP-binding protein/permease [Desulfobulbaceae bacterium]|nr:ABC transporter ATP-binding protein/permease [Desulfobulbaceae bacterium]HIJ90992.1 ABC transporter ATP-binding protein [Deltaproteobacteria bacterium]